MGFRSMFPRSYSAEEGWQVYIIKGGPGTGKSTLMRTVCSMAEQSGIFAQRIHCSSDPDSLDAVILPTLRRAIYDGTAPHVMEPALPGACECLVDLGQGWDSGILHSRREEIARLSSQCSALHRRATQMLACADVFRERMSLPALEAADRDKILRTARRLCRRFGLKARSSRGSVTERLACAVTPKGILNVSEEYISSFGRVVPVYDGCSALSGLLLSALSGMLTDMGHSVILCPCSQCADRPEHLLLPEEDICFTTRTPIHGLDTRTDSDERAVHTERFLPDRPAPQVCDRRELLRFTDLAAGCMREAKAIHDDLESCYRDAMDFDRVDAIARRTAELILG